MLQSIKKNHYAFSAATLLGLTLLSGAACASGVQDAISSRAELSEFNSLLTRTGVSGTLSGGSHTVFAPINDAFSAYSDTRYPYLYSGQYPNFNDVAIKIAQNHIVDGTVYLDDVVKQQGGVYAINGRFIAVSEYPKDHFNVDGHPVISSHTLEGGGALYIIDGLIAKPGELTEIAPGGAVVVVPTPNSDTVIQMPPHSNVIMDEQVSPGVTERTTITTH